MHLRSPVKLAIFLSLALHVVLGSWVLREGRMEIGLLSNPVLPEQRLSVQLLPPSEVKAFKPASQPAPPAPPAHQAPDKARRIEQPSTRPTPNSRLAGTIAAPMPSSPALEVQTATIAVATPATPASAATPALQLDLRRAALEAERGRDQTSVASAMHAQLGRSPQPSSRSAFSHLSAVPSGIVAETTLAGDARVLQFSGGGCMVFANAAARVFEDVRKPMMTNC